VLHHDVSVVVPARNEATTLDAVVQAIAALGYVHEIVVVDDGSTDATAQVASAAGARVVAASSGPGKGSAMWDGVASATGDLVVFCDADLTDFDARLVTTLATTLTRAGRTTALVKGDYERPGEGGRVTELVARPVLRLLHPHLAHLAQPLGGEYAAWRDALHEVPFVCGYGVELGLLLDLAARHGPDAIAQVHLGVRRHRNRPLSQLAPQAQEVLAVALQRAGGPGITVDERPPLASLPRGHGSPSRTPSA
jgi:glucosyl-3-phosphoglycerate synthase